MITNKSQTESISISNSESTEKLAIFDFDGTLTTRDTLLAFIEFSRGKGRLYQELLLLSPELILMKLGFGNNEKVKTKLLSRLFKGVQKETLEKLAEDFCTQNFTSLLRPQGLAKLQELKVEDYRIILVTASVDIWVKPFAKKLGLELIATEFLFKDQVFTGRLATPNCRGTEKVNRLKKYLKQKKIPPYLMFGDSDGDQALYDQANQYFHRHFH